MIRPVTDERLWRSWPTLAALPRLPAPGGRVVVISAHPDDEVLGAGGVIAGLAGTSAELSFVTVTDGEASHPGAPVDPTTLAEQRAVELVDALRALGHPDASITRLKLPDSGVSPYVKELAPALRTLTEHADLVLCPAATDGHPDHAAVGRVALEVCRDRVPVWQYPIWMWHWTTPGTSSVDWNRAGRRDLPAVIVDRKRAALQCFATQLHPLPGDESGTVIVPPAALAHFERSFEVFFT